MEILTLDLYKYEGKLQIHLVYGLNCVWSFKMYGEPIEAQILKISRKTGIPLYVFSERSYSKIGRMHMINDNDLPRESTPPWSKNASRKDSKATKQPVKKSLKKGRSE